MTYEAIDPTNARAHALTLDRGAEILAQLAREIVETDVAAQLFLAATPKSQLADAQIGFRNVSTLLRQKATAMESISWPGSCDLKSFQSPTDGA